MTPLPAKNGPMKPPKSSDAVLVIDTDAEPLIPYQYRLIWVVLREPLAADELRSYAPGGYAQNTAQGVSNMLRPLVKRGWLARSQTGIYYASPRARMAVSW